MSEQVAAAPPPPPPAAETHEAKPTPPAQGGDKFAQAIALLGRAKDGKFTPPPPGVTPPAPAAKPDAPAAPPPAADALKQAREQQEAMRAARERVEAKKAQEQAQAKLAELAVFEGKDPAAVAKALKARGITLEQLAKAELESPDEVEEDPRVRELREKVEGLERERQEQQRQQAYQHNLTFVGKLIADNATELPLLQGYGNAKEVIVSRCQKHFDDTKEQPDERAVALAYHEQIMSELDQILGPDAALEAWLSRPETQKRALKILKAKTPSAGPASDEGANGPGNDASAVNSSPAAASGAPRQAGQTTSEGRYAAALDELRKRQRNR